MKITRLSEVWSELEQLASAEQVLRIGATPLRDEHYANFAEWLEQGHHGTMEYLRRHGDVRRDPVARYPWAKSVVAITVPYSPDLPEEESIAAATARYALGNDYHDVLDRILRRLEEALTARDAEIRSWRYVDTGPLSDRSMAAQSGLGWIGKNGMLIDERNGSYFFIGLLLTSLECDVKQSSAADRCGTCTRCVDACPTEAILPGRLVDSNRCISHATIEQRGPLDDWMKERLGGHLFGCDICQEVCPWNGRAPEGIAELQVRDGYRATPISDLLRFDQSMFSTLFQKSAIKRTKRAGLIRNAILIAPEIDEETMAALQQEDDPGIVDALQWRNSKQ